MEIDAILVASRRSESELVLGIDAQDTNRGASQGCSAHDMDSIPLEVITPSIFPRMKQAAHFPRFGIDAGKI
jgi:hypothetical protein